MKSSSPVEWAYLNGVELDFSRPDKAADSAMIEALQRQAEGGVPQRELVLVFGGCTGEDRGVVAALQLGTSPWVPGNLAPETFALVATAAVQ